MSEHKGREEPPSSPAAQELPSVEELRSSVEAAPIDAQLYQRQFEEEFRKNSYEAETAYTHLLGLRDHYHHKKIWSGCLLVLMFLMVIYQSVLMSLVGSGIWDFTKYEWLLPALLVQNLAQIVGLALIVVKALFKDLS